MKTLRIISTLLLFIAFSMGSSAQSNDVLYKKGLAHKKAGENDKYLAIFQQLIAADSNNVSYLTNCSFAYSKAGYHQPTEKEKQAYYKKAEKLARKAIGINPKDAQSHYTHAVALGRINENASSRQKLMNARIIRARAEKAIELDPKLAGAFHIMGRWHRTIADFNAMEKAMINTFMGGVPEGGTFEDAVINFQKAVKLEPNYSLHMYELALTYYKMKNKSYAKAFLTKAMALPVKNEDDETNYQKCEDLMKKLK